MFEPFFTVYGFNKFQLLTFQSVQIHFLTFYARRYHQIK